MKKYILSIFTAPNLPDVYWMPATQKTAAAMIPSGSVTGSVRSPSGISDSRRAPVQILAEGIYRKTTSLHTNTNKKDRYDSSFERITKQFAITNTTSQIAFDLPGITAWKNFAFYVKDYHVICAIEKNVSGPLRNRNTDNQSRLEEVTDNANSASAAAAAYIRLF